MDTANTVLKFERPTPKLLTSETSSNWLKDLPLGSRFLSRDNGNRSFILNEFIKTGEFEDAVLLCEIQTNTREGAFFFVDSARFSSQNILFETLPSEGGQNELPEKDEGSEVQEHPEVDGA